MNSSKGGYFENNIGTMIRATKGDTTSSDYGSYGSCIRVIRVLSSELWCFQKLDGGKVCQ